MNKNLQPCRGFTLIEVLLALAIYSVLIATLVVVNRNGLDNLADTEAKALARRALLNVVVQFQDDYRRGKVSANTARHSGTYRMAERLYRWEINVQSTQNQLAKILSAQIQDAQSDAGIANVQVLL